jgi:hypothetical protein
MLLRAAVVAAVKAWEFSSSKEETVGYITFEGTIALVSPDGEIIKNTN